MWFEDLVGFAEVSATQVRRLLTVEDSRMTSTVNGRVMGCGVLEIPSLGELRQSTDRYRSEAGGPTVRQVVGDVASLHRESENAGALFQAASQFNLLEMVSPDVTPEEGVTRYQFDRTQGPACAVACGAGTIFRNYFVNVNGSEGQTRDNQIDCLADIGSHLFRSGESPWTMRNGYALFDSNQLDSVNSRLSEMDSDELDATRARLRIGFHRNVEVTSAPTAHTVSQAYCSALPVAYNDAEPARFETFARIILEAAYEATLHAAVLNREDTGNATVYLTLLGGGVFGNSEEWILDAVKRACTKLAGHELDVAVVSYGSPSTTIESLVSSI